MCNLNEISHFLLVDIRLHEPLWKSNRSLDEIAVEILALSAQLEGMCKDSYTVSIAVSVWLHIYEYVSITVHIRLCMHGYVCVAMYGYVRMAMYGYLFMCGYSSA